MSRCKACDAIMKPSETRYNKFIDQEEDLCRKCKASLFYTDKEEVADENISIDGNVIWERSRR